MVPPATVPGPQVSSRLSQLALHGSPGVPLLMPSSHCSVPFTMPSPHSEGGVPFGRTASATPGAAATTASVAQPGSGSQLPASEPAVGELPQAADILSWPLMTDFVPWSTHAELSGPNVDAVLSKNSWHLVEFLTISLAILVRVLPIVSLHLIFALSPASDVFPSTTAAELPPTVSSTTAPTAVWGSLPS